MESQLQFDFMKEIDKNAGKVCLKCENFLSRDSVCLLIQGETDPQSNCESWKQGDPEMDEISSEAKNEFDWLMDKYSVSSEDRERIYINARWF